MVLLTPFQQKLLQKALQTELRSEYRRRIEIMLLADAGQTQTQICQALNCSHATARYWISIAQSGLAHHWERSRIGRPKIIGHEYRDRLRVLVTLNPRDLGYPFRRWTARWLNKQMTQEFGVQVSDRYINHLLKEMGLSTRRSTSVTESITEKETIRIQVQPADDCPWSL